MTWRLGIRALLLSLGIGISCASAASAYASEAGLKPGLTPLGAETAGSKDGRVPAWDGGYLKPLPGQEKGYLGANPFPGEKPIFTVTAANYAQYANLLSQGQIALLKKYPTAYELNVYPSHRTEAAPGWVYKNTASNARNGRMANGIPEGVYGGIPFPEPKTGAEVMWNHMLRWRGPYVTFPTTDYEITPDGNAVLVSVNSIDQQMPYYFKNGDAKQFAHSGIYWQVFVTTSAPPLRSGQMIDGGTNLDSSKDQAWVYLPGERRTRQLPNPCCDTPTPSTANVTTFDEIQVWTGTIDRYNWKILGKKEMIIPYNDNITNGPVSAAAVVGAHFIKPQYERWEVHRVWEVEATLKPGKRDQVAKSIYYCDEDSWTCVLADRWDSKGNLWRTLSMLTFIDPRDPGIEDGAFTMNDLLSGGAFIANLPNRASGELVQHHEPFDASHFTAGAMSAAGID
jgi:hypothetical protein